MKYVRLFIGVIILLLSSASSIVSQALISSGDTAILKSTLPDPLAAGWKGEPVCEVLFENDTIRSLKCSFPPGVGHERHYHAAHFGYTLAGSRFRISDSKGVREVDVPTGTHFYNKEIEWHEVLNIGDSLAVFLIIEPK